MKKNPWTRRDGQTVQPFDGIANGVGRRRSRVRTVALLAAAASGISLLPHPTQAATETWNPGLSATSGTDGLGNWDAGGTSDWYTGSLATWTNGNTAVIGAGTGAAGTITLGSGVSAGGITFNNAGSGNYTLGGSNALSLTTGATITDNASGTTTISVNLDQSGSPTLNYAGAGTLAITGNIGVSGAPVALFENAAGGTLNLSGTNFIAGNVGAAAATVQAGTLTISGGVTTVNSSNDLDIGNGAAATGFNMTGGALTVNSQFVIGGHGSSTTATQSGGSIIVNNSGIFYVGGYAGAGTSSYTLSGNGTLAATTLNFGGGGSENGTFELAGGTLSLSGVTVSAVSHTATFNFNGGMLTAQATNATFFQILNGTLNVNVRNGGAIINTGNFSDTIAVPLVHSAVPGDNATDGGLTKFGTGILTLSSANTYTGVTTLSAGTLNLGITETAGTSGPLGKSVAANPGSIVLAGGTLQYSAANQNDYSGRFSTTASQAYNIDTNGQPVTFATALTSSGGALTKLGAGVLTLTASNTYTGTSTLSGGTLNLGVAEVAGTSGPLGNSTASNPGSIVLSGGTLQYSALNNNDYSGRFSTAAGQIYNIDTNGQSVTYATGLTSSTGNLTKSGNGTLTLSGASIYSGPTTVSAGTLAAGITSVAGVSGAFGNNSAVVLANVASAGINITGFNTQIGSLSGGGTTGGNVTLGAATLTVGGDNSTTTYAGFISGAGGGLTKIGNGNLTLGNSETYTGTTIVSAGSLVFAGNSTLPTANTIAVNNGGTLTFARNDTFGIDTVTVTPAVTVNAGGTISSLNTFTTLKNLTLNGGQILGNGGVTAAFPGFALKGTLTVGGSQASTINAGTGNFNFIAVGDNSAGALTVNVADATGDANPDLIVNVPLINHSGSTDGLTKTGVGTMLLTASNTYTGNTLVQGGTLQVNGGGLSGPGLMDVGAAGVSQANFVLTSGNVTIGTQLVIGAHGSNSSSSQAGGTLQVNGTLFLGGYGEGTGTGTFTQSGGNFTTTSGINFGGGGPNSGNYTLSGGLLTTPSIIKNATGTATATFNFNGGTLRLGASFDPTTTISTVVQSGGAIIDTNGNNTTFAGALSQGSGSTGGLTKLNTGNLTLSANNGYTGATIISGGTLKLSGNFSNNIAASSAITVNTGATLDVTGLTNTAGTITLASGKKLGGSGTVTGNTTVAAGSTISAGTSVALGTGSGNVTGTLTTGNETWSKGGTYAVKINETNGAGTGVGGSGVAGTTTGWDEIAMGALSVSALGSGAGNTFAITLSSPAGNVSDFNKAQNYVWTIATMTGAPLTANTFLATAGPGGASTSSSLFTLDTTGFVGAGNPTLGSGSSFYLEAMSNGGNETLVIGYTATPEPGTALLVLGGVAPILMARRRKRRNA